MSERKKNVDRSQVSLGVGTRKHRAFNDDLFRTLFLFAETANKVKLRLLSLLCNRLSPSILTGTESIAHPVGQQETTITNGGEREQVGPLSPFLV